MREGKFCSRLVGLEILDSTRINGKEVLPMLFHLPFFPPDARLAALIQQRVALVQHDSRQLLHTS